MQEAQLEQWVSELLAAFELTDSQIDIDQVLSLAGVAAHTIVRPAAPLTTYLAGYAAGMAVGSGKVSEKPAMDAADALVRAVLAARAADADNA
ncbi:DUF6457 domain-containing protein [Paeniglutamicibacter terrestris]|uniref:Molybdopterin-guanine dinucleotide biosynthesis protein n=1 Tax=Paeniglutamicibacter terrestris TaxID=2723403 RepID=A0ABX1G6C3_9MICC|nr:DUF6457 domain-containing protein [Paeniglutamicibacter terrestris]ASN40472.1 molybdopterin-guanine dinucleotide biosynthesis protein [Arthrobacter sp. 7749]NKG21589.1 molybdopterin-guanine dinucleotide biosynthesis protein [Paeniglutamicibacter terrestris]